MLVKLIKGPLSVVCGPLIEAMFNLMDDCMEEDQIRLTQQNLEAKLMIEYFWKSRNLITTDMEVAEKMRQKVLSAKATMFKYQRS